MTFSDGWWHAESVCGFEGVDGGDIVLKLEVELVDQLIGDLAPLRAAHLADDGFDHWRRPGPELVDRRLDALSRCVEAHIRITRLSAAQSQLLSVPLSPHS